MTGLAAVGLFDGAVGVLWPSVRHTFDQPLAALGIVLVAYTGGYFCTSLAGGWLLERVGTGRGLLGVPVAAAPAGPACWSSAVGGAGRCWASQSRRSPARRRSRRHRCGRWSSSVAPCSAHPA